MFYNIDSIHGCGLGTVYSNICIFFEKEAWKALIKKQEYFLLKKWNIFKQLFKRKTSKKTIEPLPNKGWKGGR